MDGTSEWTEPGTEQGLDHLAMLSPVETHYQSLLPGFSSVTTRLRNYSFYAFWVAHYKRNVRNDAQSVFEDQTRRVEALYALASAQREGETGVAGATFADAKLQEERDSIDFRLETDFETAQDDRYLAPRGGAFPGVYFGQMSEIGLIVRGTGHRLPVPDPDGPCEALAAAYESSLGETIGDFLRHAEDGRITRANLAPMERMAPSALDQESEEAAILRSLLMGEDGAAPSINRRATLLAILEIAGTTVAEQATGETAGKVTEDMLRWWWMDNAPEGPSARIHRAWQHYQVGDMVRLVYESVLNHAILALEEVNDGLSVPALLGDVLAPVPDTTLKEWFSTVSDGSESPKELQAHGLVHDATVGEILAPFARLWRDWRDQLDVLSESYKDAPGHQNCLTELRWIEDRREQSARSALGQLLHERVLRRHLEVAARKFRMQSTTPYTYLIEVENARLRARGKVNVNASGPRLATALRFLEDVDFLRDGLITPRGREYLENAS